MPRRPQEPKATHWAATINNPAGLLDWTQLEESLKFLVYQKETAPETGTPHFQCYFQTKSPMRMTALKKLPGMETAHFEKCKGTPEQNIAYCTKEESRLDGPFEHGERPPPKGARSDIAKACATLVETKSIEEVAIQHPTTYVKYYRGFEQLLKKVCPPVEEVRYPLTSFNPPEDLDLTKCCVVFGNAGIGKTEFALAHFERPLLVRHLDVLGSFSPRYHDGIVFDDMSFTHFPFGQRIHLTDMTRASDIHIRYVTAHIPPGTKKIFCYNTGDVFTHHDPEKEQLTEAQYAAIARRVNFYGPWTAQLFV